MNLVCPRYPAGDDVVVVVVVVVVGVNPWPYPIVACGPRHIRNNMRGDLAGQHDLGPSD